MFTLTWTIKKPASRPNRGRHARYYLPIGPLLEKGTDTEKLPVEIFASAASRSKLISDVKATNLSSKICNSSLIQKNKTPRPLLQTTTSNHSAVFIYILPLLIMQAGEFWEPSKRSGAPSNQHPRPTKNKVSLTFFITIPLYQSSQYCSYPTPFIAIGRLLFGIQEYFGHRTNVQFVSKLYVSKTHFSRQYQSSREEDGPPKRWHPVTSDTTIPTNTSSRAPFSIGNFSDSVVRRKA
jgi:hypothetical protein